MAHDHNYGHGPIGPPHNNLDDFKHVLNVYTTLAAQAKASSIGTQERTYLSGHAQHLQRLFEDPQVRDYIRTSLHTEPIRLAAAVQDIGYALNTRWNTATTESLDTLADACRAGDLFKAIGKH